MQRVQQRNFLQKLQIYNLEESKGLVPTFVVFLTLTTFFPSKIKVHWMQVNTMLKELPEEEFGPIINIREYSFFDNPAVPRQACQNWPHMDGTLVFCHPSLTREISHFDVCFRSRSHGSMYNFVKQDPLIVMYQPVRADRGCSNYPNSAVKKRYYRFPYKPHPV